MKVLLIDDSSTMRKIQKRALSEIEITDIDEAENGLLGLEKLKAENFAYDFVLLDMNMPEMSGLEVLTAVRAQGEKVPIIMCTSVADKEVVMQCIKAGANNYVVKPFKPDELQKKIQAIKK